MSRHMVALVVGLGFVFATVGTVHLGAAERTGRDGLNTKPGTYRLYRGLFHLKIHEDKGKLNYEIRYPIVVRSFPFWRTMETGSFSPSEPFIERGPGGLPMWSGLKRNRPIRSGSSTGAISW